MSPYEIVNLVVTIERYDPDLTPFLFDWDGVAYRVICVRNADNQRREFETSYQWFTDITDREIQVPDEAFNLFMGLADVRQKQKALRS